MVKYFQYQQTKICPFYTTLTSFILIQQTNKQKEIVFQKHFYITLMNAMPFLLYLLHFCKPVGVK